jgi:hypothetical protein
MGTSCAKLFISYDEIRIHASARAISNTLALTAGKLMRVTLDKPLAETDRFQSSEPGAQLLCRELIRKYQVVRQQSDQSSFADSVKHTDPEKLFAGVYAALEDHAA